MKLEFGPNTEKKIDLRLYCLFISGGTGTTAGIRGIKEGLESHYGSGRVEAFNSVLNFKDPQNPKRFEQMADIIQSHSKEGLDIVAHSLGAAELKKTIDIVKKRDKTFFDKKENVENLHIVLVSPSGFSEGIRRSFESLARISHFIYEEAGFGPVYKRNSPYRGIETLTAFPPEGIDPKDLAEALRKAFPKLSQLKDNQSAKIVFLREKQNYSNKLPIYEKEQAKAYSNIMKTAILDGDYNNLRRLVICYGELLKNSLDQIFRGNFESAKMPIVEAARSTMGGYIGLINILIEAFGGKPMREIAQLKAKGVRVDFIIPEYDIILPLVNVIKFFDSSKESYAHAEVLAATAHSFVALQADGFGEMVKNFRQDESL